MTSPTPDGASSHAAECAALVRAHDPDRFFAAQFAPEAHRDALLALLAFNHEVARVRDIVREPLPGEVRLQWWRDALTGQAHGDVASHPVASSLNAAIVRYSLPRQPLIDLIDARIFDLYDDPMPSLNDLEGYCGETVSALMRLSMLVLADGEDPGGSDAAGHAGVAYAMTGLLRALPVHAARGQVYLPGDLMQSHGVTRDDILTGHAGPPLMGLLAALRQRAAHHVQEVARLWPQVAPAARPALLPVALVPGYLAALARNDQPLRLIVEVPLWRRLWALWRWSRR
jgi:phytoene synthase